MTRFRDDHPYLIAEVGVNHDGRAAVAHQLVDGAAEAGFDAVKFQYWIVDELLAREAPNAAYQGMGDQRTLLASLELDLDELRALGEHARRVGLDFIVTPDGRRACADVISLGVEVMKVGSGDADNPWLLDAVCDAGLPTILSTGMMTDAEVERSVARLAGLPELVVLHCVTAYPTKVQEADLSRIGRLGSLTGRPVGFSDHTVGVAAATAAVALGAVAIEKHITHDVRAPGPDHAASLPLDGSGAWVTTLREVSEAVHGLRRSQAEEDNRAVVRKALHAARPLAAGDRISPGDLVPLRPLLDGIGAGELDGVVGRVTARPLPEGQRLTWEDLA